MSKSSLLGATAAAVIACSSVSAAKRPPPDASVKEASFVRYALKLDNGTEDLEVRHVSNKKITFNFHRRRFPGCEWNFSGTAATLTGMADELEDENGDSLPIVYYRVTDKTKCEMFVGLEWQNEQRAQVTVGPKCGDTCGGDGPRFLHMVK